MSLFFPDRSHRSTEAAPAQIAATGAAGGYGAGYDPIDGDVGFRPLGGGNGRGVPHWSLERARTFSVNAYRANPMGRAIIDTYVAFAVGDSGLTVQVPAELHDVREVVDGFWCDPRNKLDLRQELLLRDHMLMGETALEMVVGAFSGFTRFSPIDPGRVAEVLLLNGNVWWPRAIKLHGFAGDGRELAIVDVDDFTGRRAGEVMWWASFQALATDTRGMPFMSAILDDLEAYDTVIANLVDRTALMRYLAWDVTLKGNVGTKEIDDYIASRGGTHVPPAGSMEVHNEQVEIAPFKTEVGSAEDTNTAGQLLTNVAGGAGLAKTWLADPENSNRATSLSMAEPVRRRVQAVQKMWLGYMTELVRFRVDQAVTFGRLPERVLATDVAGGDEGRTVPTSSVVKVTGPEVAAADAQVTAEIMSNLAQSLNGMVAGKITSPEAARIAWNKAWEQFVGIPYTRDLDPKGENVDDLAEIVDTATATKVAVTA